jgi:ribosome-associated toxin RatA of RatAB toxin-antitoxin module
MPDMIIDALVPAAQADDVYRQIRDFEAYPRYTDAVREVTVVPLDQHTVEARWSVNFRNGVLRWIEHDTFDDATRQVTFRQTTGDFDRFDGIWSVRQRGADVTVRLTCSFDLGMPSLAAMIDPIACEALVENIDLILRGLLGDDVSIRGGTAPAPAPAPTASMRWGNADMPPPVSADAAPPTPNHRNQRPVGGRPVG